MNHLKQYKKFGIKADTFGVSNQDKMSYTPKGGSSPTKREARWYFIDVNKGA